jgi:hypothetical protein
MKVVFSVIQKEENSLDYQKIVYQMLVPSKKSINNDYFDITEKILNYLTEESLKKRMLIGISVDEIASKLEKNSLNIYSAFINNIIENDLGYGIIKIKDETINNERHLKGKVFSKKEKLETYIDICCFQPDYLLENLILVPNDKILSLFDFYCNKKDLKDMIVIKP